MLHESLPHLQEMRSQLYANHEALYKGDRPMGCCSKSSGRAGRRSAPAFPTDNLQLGQMPLVEVRYTGAQAKTVRGAKTGAFYKFLPRERRYVDSRDLPGLLADSAFQRLDILPVGPEALTGVLA
jgi:hypothetical protein